MPATGSLPTFTASTQGNTLSPTNSAPPSSESLERAARLVELALNRPAIVAAGNASPESPERRSGLHGKGRVLVACVPIEAGEGAGSSFVCRHHEIVGNDGPLDRAIAPVARSHGADSYAILALDPPHRRDNGATAVADTALCILSREPHDWTPAERHGLATVASSL